MQANGFSPTPTPGDKHTALVTACHLMHVDTHGGFTQTSGLIHAGEGQDTPRARRADKHQWHVVSVRTCQSSPLYSGAPRPHLSGIQYMESDLAPEV